MEWYKVFSIILSVLSILGLGTVASMFWKDFRDRRVQKSQVFKDAKKKEQQDMIREVIAEENAPIVAQISEIKKDIDALNATDRTQRKAIQAILRDRLYSLSKKYLAKGWVDKDESENFENIYQQYHNLGKNGIMDSRREKVLELPTEEEFLRNQEGSKEVGDE